MPIPRIYQPIFLQTGLTIQLSEEAAHHLARVLRVKKNDSLILFNGAGGEYESVITEINKKTVLVKIERHHVHESESALELCLAQGISRGEKMDYTIQKAVELGIKKIIPVITERCTVKLSAERSEKKLQHWRSIVISACEQSGRNTIPDITAPEFLPDFLEKIKANWKFILSPTATKKITDIPFQKAPSIILLVGPEGGFSEKEIRIAEQHEFIALNLGPRIMRTETAAIAAISVLQYAAGDFG